MFKGDKIPSKFEHKLVRIGESSVGVILPKAWLRYNEMKNGDIVELIANENVIVKPLKDNGGHNE